MHCATLHLKPCFERLGEKLIHSLLVSPCSSQASFNLPKAVKFDPHMPQVNLDSKKVTASQACSAALKQHLAEILKQPVEARLLTLKPGEYTCTCICCDVL